MYLKEFLTFWPKLITCVRRKHEEVSVSVVYAWITIVAVAATVFSIWWFLDCPLVY